MSGIDWRSVAAKWSAGAVLTGAIMAAWAGMAGAADGRPEGPTTPPAPKSKPAPPPGWDHWTERQRQEWTRRLEQARQRVRERARARERAALMAMEQAARRGAPITDAEQMAIAGLDEGLDPADFEPLGRAVSEWARSGLTGQKLAEAIHQEIQRRREARKRALELKKTTKQQKGRRQGRPERVDFIHRRGPGGPPGAGSTAGRGGSHGSRGRR